MFMGHKPRSIWIDDDNVRNIAPAQDSPMNIVNILNDDCIQGILLKLDDLNDFWNAAHVCLRFQENAKMCFPFKSVQFSMCGEKRDKNEFPFDSAEEFLSLFGPRIKFISCSFASLSMNIGFQEKILHLISQFCGTTLNELEIIGHNILFLKSSFPVLKKLKLDGIAFYNSNAPSMFPELQSLELYKISETVYWLENSFSMLQCVKMELVARLTDAMFIEFQSRNPQIQRFMFALVKVLLHRLGNILEIVCQIWQSCFLERSKRMLLNATH